MGLNGIKVKQRISKDPRNKRWAQDNSRVGFTMLQKMGWSSGDGLGQDLQGRATNIKVVKKDNQMGIGAECTSSDNWLEHQNALDDLFAGLNNGTNDDSAQEPIASQPRHGRLYHRQKFARSKQVSNYDQGARNTIFGKSEKQVAIETVDKQVPAVALTSDFVEIKSKQNINEYFKEKMKKLNGQ